MKHLAVALAAASSLVLFSPAGEARPFGRGHGFAGHHAGFHGFRGARQRVRGTRAVSVRHHHSGVHGYRRLGFRSARYGRSYGHYGYRRGYRGIGLAAGLGLGLAATAARPAYYGASYGYGYGYRYAPAGYGLHRPYYGCGY